MRPFVLLCFLLTLLPLGVLAHDLYLAYQEAEQAHVQFGEKPVNFTDVGFLWVQYSPDTYDWARRTTTPETWRNIIDPLLQKTALILAIIPVAILTSVLIVFRLIRNTPLFVRMRTAGRQKQGKTRGGIAIQGIQKSRKKMSYKRK